MVALTSIILAAIVAVVQDPVVGPPMSGDQGKQFVMPPANAAPLVKARAYEKSIEAAFKAIDAPLVVDLPYGIHSFYDLILPNDVHGLERASVLWGRRLTQTNGAYIVHRIPPSRFSMVGQGFAGLYFWLDQLRTSNPGQFAGLVQGGVDFNDLDDDGKQIVSNYWGGAPGAVSGAVAGTPVNVSLHFIPMAIQTDTSGNQRFAQGTFPMPGRDGLPLNLTRLPVKMVRPLPFKNLGDGELDLGKGSVMSLLELINKAEDQFHFQFYLDDRDLDTPVFAKGKFTEKRILAVLDAVCRVPIMAINVSLQGTSLTDIERSVLGDLVDRFSGADPATLAYMQKLANDGRDPLDPNALKAFGLNFPDPDPSLSVSLGMMLHMESTFQRTDEDGAVVSVPTGGSIVIPGR